MADFGGFEIEDDEKKPSSPSAFGGFEIEDGDESESGETGPAASAEASTPKSSAPKSASPASEPESPPAPTWESGDGGEPTLPVGEKNQWGGNLRTEGRKPLIRRDANGKVSGYSTTHSMFVKHDNGRIAVVPTVVDGVELSTEDAARHYADTGEYWGMADNEEGAKKIANAVHDEHQKAYQEGWNNYIQDHWDDMGDEIRRDPGVRGERARRRRDARLAEEMKAWGRDAEAIKGYRERTKTTQVAPELFLTGDVLEDADGNAIKPGDAIAVYHKEGDGPFTGEAGQAARLMEFTGVSEDGKPVFKETEGVSSEGAMVAGKLHVRDEDFDRMTGKGEGKVERSPFEQVRLGALAETGDRRRYADDMIGTAKAVYDRLMPYAGRMAPSEQRERTRHLSNIYEGKLDSYEGKTEAEKYRDAARKAGLEPWNPLESLHPDEDDAEFMGRIQHDAGEELRLDAIAKLDAGGKLSATEQSVLDKIVKGGIESGGYALEFALPGGAIFKGAQALNWGAKAVRAATMLGSAVPVVATESMSRYQENITPEYGFDDSGEFRMVAAPDDEEEAAYKAIGGAAFDTGVEVGLEAATMGLLRLAGKPAGWLLGKATPGAVKEWGAKKFNRFMASETGLALRQINRAYQDFAGMTQINSPLGELAEENVQAFEKVIGLDGKSSEYKGLAKEWQDFKDNQLSWKTQWDIFYGLIAQLTIGSAKSAEQGIVQHISSTDARRDIRMALKRSGISDETISTLTPKQQRALDHMWRHYSSNPDELKAKVKNLGHSMRAAVDELTARDGLKMRQSLEQRGIAPEKFTIQTGANGKPAFQHMERFTPDGKKAPMNAMTDAAHGVTIVDQGDGTFYVMNDLRGLDAIPAYSFKEAQKKADAEVVRNQSMDADNAQKAQYLMGLVLHQYAGRNVVSIPSEAALRWQIADALRRKTPIFGITRADQLFKADGSLNQPGAGGFHTPDGHIVVILDNVPSPAEMERVLAHEATGHEGVESATGRGAKTVEFIQNAQAEGFSKFVLAEQKRAVQRFVAAGMDEATARMQVAAAMSTDDYAREAMARYAQGRLHAPTWYERQKHELNQRRRDAGEEVPIDQSDLEVMLADAEKLGAQGANELETLPGDSGVRYEEGATDEAGNGADEAQPQPEQGEERGQEAPQPEAGAEPGAQAPDAGVVEQSKSNNGGQNLNTAERPAPADTIGGDAGRQPMSESSFWNVMHRKGERRRVPVDGIRIPDTQFKENADPKTGVVKGQELGEYYENAENPIAIYERKDGTMEIVTGRHRLDAAKRSGWKDIDARIFREADGYTPEDMRLYDAVANILDEKGTVKDYVRFFDESGFSEEDAKSSGILNRQKGRMAFGIVQNATDDTRGAIDWEGTGGDGLISAEQAAIIADAAPKQAALQRILVRRALDGVRGKKLAILARSLAEEAKNRKNAPKADSGTQLDLFTSEEDVALLQQEENRADYRAKKANEYKRIAENLRTAMRKGGRLDLNKDYAKELGISDPKDKAQLAAARDKAVERANYWENAIRLDDADKAQMDEDLGIAPQLQLESPTAKQLEEEKKKQEERDKIKEGLAKPIRGSGQVHVQPEMDLGQTGQQDLFSPIAESEATAPAAKKKAAERPAEYLAWLEKYKMNDTDKHFAEWQRKQSGRVDAQGNPVGAPKKTKETTPPKATKPPKEEAPKADETMAAKNIDVSAFVKAQRGAEADDDFEGDRGLADLIESLPPEKAQKLVSLWNESDRLDNEADKLVDEHGRLTRFNQTKFDSDENERKYGDLRARARDLNNEAHNMLLREAEANGWEQGDDAETGGVRWVKRPAQKHAKTAPASAPRTKGTTTPPKSADAPRGVKSAENAAQRKYAELLSRLDEATKRLDAAVEAEKKSGGAIADQIASREAIIDQYRAELAVRRFEREHKNERLGQNWSDVKDRPFTSLSDSGIRERIANATTSIAQLKEELPKDAPKSSASTTPSATPSAKPAFKRGDRVFLKGAKDVQRVTFLKANADGTADVQVRTPGANRYAPEKVETRTVPMGDISATGMKETLTEAERNAYLRGVAEQTREAMRNDPALRRIDAAYRAAKTDAERAELKAQFAERVRALQGGVNFDTSALAGPSGRQKQAGVTYPDASEEIRAQVSFDTPEIGKKSREDFGRILAKHRPDLDANAVIDEIAKFDTPKKRKAALHWVVRGAIQLPEDAYKVEDALSVAEKAKVDPFAYRSPLELIDAHKDIKPTRRAIDPATVPELSDPRDDGDGIVSYEVADTREGQAAMRRIIDTHWGEDANPWCLLARSGLAETREQTGEYKEWLLRHWHLNGDLDATGDRYERETGKKAYKTVRLSAEQRMSDAWDYWNRYNALPKRVAFKNGRLLAFMATERLDLDNWSDYQRFQDRLEGRYPERVKEYESWTETEEAIENGVPEFLEWMKVNYGDEFDRAWGTSGVSEEWWDRKDESHPDLDWARDNAQVNFDTPGIFTGTAADYANRSRQGGVDDGPSVKKIGTGEGSQVYGWGLYGSNVRGVAESYATYRDGDHAIIVIDGKEWKPGEKSTIGERVAYEQLDDFSNTPEEIAEYCESRDEPHYKAAAKFIRSHKVEIREPHTHLYEQTFFTNRAEGDESHLLKWYEPVSKENIKRVLDQYAKEHDGADLRADTPSGTITLEDFGDRKLFADALKENADALKEDGASLYRYVSGVLGSEQAASEFLARAGIDGVKYPVDSYGGKGVKDGDEAGWNYVSFRDDNIRVDHKWTDGVLQFDTPELSPVTPAEDAAYMDAVKRGDTETAQRMVREAAAKAMPAAIEVKLGYGEERPAKMLAHEVRSMPKEFAAEIGKWDAVAKSPYSDSFYNSNDISWDGKPDGSLRISNHWNFRSSMDDGKTHCKTNVPVENEKTWALGRWNAEKDEYEILKVLPAVGEWTGPSRLVRNFIGGRERIGGMEAEETATTKMSRQALSVANGGKVPFRNHPEVMLDTATGQIKTLDPVTYDDAGNVIPLQQRFNPQNDDIRFDTPELTPAEEEYAASEDKTPTEKVMREVYGMTNDEIATALRAAGMEPPPHVRKSDEVKWQQAEALLSNPTYMAKLSRAVAKFPRPLRDYEIDALNVLFRERQNAVNAAQGEVDDWKQTLDSIADGEIGAAEKKEDARKNLAAAQSGLARAKALMLETGKAKIGGTSEQGRGLRANRGSLYQDDLTYAGITGEIARIVGGAERVTPEMDAKIRELAKLFEDLDEQGLRIATERLKPLAEKVIKQTKDGLKVRKATERRAGDEAKRVTRNYEEALNQIEVGAAEVGGTLIGLSDQQYPSWGRWLKAIGEFHCFQNPNITEEEVINAILEDISPFMDGVDANQVRDALTGFGHNFKQSRYDSQRLMNDLKSQARLKRQLDWMDENNTMPPLTGMVRDEPSDVTRNLQKQVAERKKEVPDAGRDERRLKGILDSAKKRVQNRIADLERAIATGERIPAAQRKVVEDIELRELKKRKDKLQKAYDELFGTERTMTDAQRIAATEKALARMMEQTMEDFARAQSGDFSKRPQRPGVTSETIETLRDRIRQVRESIRELKNAKYAFGMTPEEIEALNARKMANREKALARLAERVATGDIRPQKKPQPPMTKDQQKRYDEIGEQMKRGRQKLAELRLEAENATVPTFVRKGVNFLRFVTTAQRALRATMDFSAVLRQAARMTLGHPVKAARAFGKAWTAARSEASLLDVNTEIMSDPTVQEAVKKFGLHLREVDAQSDRDVEMFHGMERNKVKIFGKEYAITDIPLFGEFMLKSERHYLTYLNAMSADLYTSIVNGIPGGATQWQKKMIADMINIWNGSAALSKERRQALQKAWVNDIFWAPQLAISRVQSAVGYDWWHPLVAKGIKNADGSFDKVSNDERKTAAKIGLREHLRSTVAMLAIGALLKWLFSDDDDKYDFSQADWFEKMMMLVSPKIGNTTIDLTGGESTFDKLVHQLVTRSKRTGTGRLQKFGDFNGPSTWGVIGRYLQGKLSPSASTITALWDGKDYVGEEYGAGKMVREMLVPLTFEDVKDQIVQNGVGKSLVTVPLSILGAGGSTYDRKPYENAVNRFLEAKKEYDTIGADQSLEKDERDSILVGLRKSNPLMRDEVREKISARVKRLKSWESKAKKVQKTGKSSAEIDAEIEKEKENILNMIRAARK